MTALPSRSGRLSGPAGTNGREPWADRQSSVPPGSGPTLRDPWRGCLARLIVKIAAAAAVGGSIAGCSIMPWHKAPPPKTSSDERVQLETRLTNLRAELAQRQAEQAQSGQAEAQPASPPTPEEDSAQRAKLQARLDTLKAELAAREASESGKLGARAGAEDLFSGRARAAAIADEPQAAIIGRMALESGGSAADAAAAMYFALSVTHPAAASLGGGGICLARSADGRVDSLDFLARAPSGGGAIAIPGNLAGMATLQARYGVMRWAAVVLPAERLAGAGTVTHALAADIAKLPASANDQALQAIGRRPAGEPYQEGDSISRPDLSMMLTQLSANGISAFYNGALGRAFVQAANAKGGDLTDSDLQNYSVKVAPAGAADLAGSRVFMPSPETGAGQLAAEAISSAHGATDRGLIDEAVSKGLSDLGAPESLPQDFGSTSFLAVDEAGRAVACAVTMNGPFGAAVSSNGIVMAKNPATSPDGYGNAFLDPMIAANPQSRSLHAVASASAGPSALASAIEAIAVSHASPQRSARDILSSMMAGSPTGNLLICQSGEKHECSVASDPTGSGLASAIIGK